jgi:hypothetical protein
VNFVLSPDPAKPTANGTFARPIGATRDSIYSAGSSQASAIHADLVSWLLAKEVGAAGDAADLSGAAEQVCQKLSRRLSRLVSPAGSQAILARALHLARAEFAFLDGVRAGTAPEACLRGLDAHVLDVNASEVRKGLLAVLGLVLDLLVAFIGEDLTLRLVREVWPDLPLLAPGRPGNSDGLEAAS